MRGPGERERFSAAIEKIHHRIWDHFVDPETNLLKTRIDGGDPLEDGSLYGGFYLACLVDAHEATGSDERAWEAKRIFDGLKRNAEVSGIPGFLARGTAPDGTYRSDPSVDQYTGFLYGCWRYFHSPLPGEEERDRIRRLSAEVLTRLEASSWRITGEDGKGTTFGDLDALCPTRAERLLAFLRAGYDLTGDERWLAHYRELQGPRLEHCRTYEGTPAWVGLQSQVCLRMLTALEKDPQVVEKYAQGIRSLAETCRPQMAALRQVPAKDEDRDPAPFYRQGRLFTEAVRNPLEAAVVLLLTGESYFQREALGILEELDARLEPERMELVWGLVPWEWGLWMARKARLA